MTEQGGVQRDGVAEQGGGRRNGRTAERAKDVFVRAWERLMLWLVAVAVAVFMPVTGSGAGRLDWRLEAIAAEVNKQGAFRDLFFVAIALAVVSMSNLADNLLRNYRLISVPGKIVATTAMTAYFIFVIYAVSHLKDIGRSAVDDATFAADWKTILGVVAVGALVEVMIALEALALERGSASPRRA